MVRHPAKQISPTILAVATILVIMSIAAADRCRALAPPIRPHPGDDPKLAEQQGRQMEEFWRFWTGSIPGSASACVLLAAADHPRHRPECSSSPSGRPMLKSASLLLLVLLMVSGCQSRPKCESSRHTISSSAASQWSWPTPPCLTGGESHIFIAGIETCARKGKKEAAMISESWRT